MATKTESILSLLNQIRNDQQLVLPDLQRDFVWNRDQIRLLMDTVMREYPFGSLLLWQTRFLEVPYRDFVQDYTTGVTFVPKVKKAGTPLRMVLDGQQRLQSLYLAIYGTHERRRLFFNITSGPGGTQDDSDDGLEAAYRFEFWQDGDTNRPKRLISVGEIVSWAARLEDQQIEKVVAEVGLKDDEANQARRNIRLVRRVMSRSDLVPVETIDDEATDQASARTIDEILTIFVRVNTGGTRLSRSDLMFSFLKSKWGGARVAFDDLIRSIEDKSPIGIDKDFVIRGLLMVTDAPVSYDVDNVQRHWDQLQPAFENFAKAVRSTVDFIRSPDVGILSRTLVQPLSTLYPLVYHIYHCKNQSVPDDQRQLLKSMLYFLLFNGFVRSEARIRYLRDELRKYKGKAFNIESILKVVQQRQKHHYTATTAQMLEGNEKLALNIVQPTVARETLSWQESAEVDHVFPQSIYRPKFPLLVDDIGNLSFLGKLRNIRKSDEMPAEYLKGESDRALADNLVISDRSLLSDAKFEEFVNKRRELIIERVKAALGR